VQPSSAELRALARRDAVLGAALRRHGPIPEHPLPATRRMPTFSFLARSICFQQLAYAAANTIWRRSCALTPGAGFPPPDDFLRLSEAQLRSAGLSRNKQAAVRDLAAHFVRGALRPASLARRSDEEVIAALTQVHGIGRWTAQMYLMFKLGRLDVMPSTDLGVQEGARRIYGLRARPDPKRLERLAAQWAPLRSVGAWICWRATDAED
jgi:3-methyladenine DNA glycosylase/8-oxoguanine DNA glycosylase